eukprot:447145_1
MGLVIELKKYNNYVSAFNCSMLSVYDKEEEILFFGPDTLLRISSVLMYDKEWQNYQRYIDGIQQILNISNGTIEWNCANNIKDIIGYILPDLYDNNTSLPMYIDSLLNYHLKNCPKKIEYNFGELVNNYEWVKNIFVKDERQQIPNVTNLCNLFKNADNIVVLMPKSLMNFDCS